MREPAGQGAGAVEGASEEAPAAAAQSTPDEPGARRESSLGAPDFTAALRRELDRRIADLAETGDDVFGRIGPGEWALMVLVSVAIPLAAVWWFA